MGETETFLENDKLIVDVMHEIENEANDTFVIFKLYYI